MISALTPLAFFPIALADPAPSHTFFSLVLAFSPQFFALHTPFVLQYLRPSPHGSVLAPAWDAFLSIRRPPMQPAMCPPPPPSICVFCTSPRAHAFPRTKTHTHVWGGVGWAVVGG